MEILNADRLVKTFPLSKKQQKQTGTDSTRKIAVNSLSFSIHKGEMYGLLGANGAGKTTTLRMIATLIKPDRGSITVDGINATREPARVRSRIGFLTSELKLEDLFTPDYTFDYFAKLHGVDADTAKARKAFLFGKLGIDQFAQTRIGELSTGMKQKASIAVSLAHDPDIVIFDEPTNGLDIITAKVVTDFLIDLKNTGKTILISSHIFSLIEKTCDRVGILVDGKMAFSDTLQNILQETTLEDKFFRVYEEVKGGAEHA